MQQTALSGLRMFVDTEIEQSRIQHYVIWHTFFCYLVNYGPIWVNSAKLSQRYSESQTNKQT